MSMPPGPPQPPDPNQPPAAPQPPYLPPPPPIPAGEYAAPAGASAYPGGYIDPLVLPPGSPFGAWIAKTQEVAKRSWKSALIITAIGIAAPRALLTLVQSLAEVSGWVGGGAITQLRDLGSAFGSILFGLFITLVFAIGASFVAAAGWAAGTWALVQEAATGQAANIQEAFRYGLKRALSLWLWTILVGVMVTIGMCFCYLPGVYLAFALSMFGFVAIFERGQNPIGRSFQMTHANFGPTLGKVAILGAVAFIYTFIIGLIFGGIGVAVGLAIGYRSSFGYNVGFGIFSAIGALLSAPAYALALLGLLPAYAEIRAQEGSLSSSAQLQQELNV